MRGKNGFSLYNLIGVCALLATNISWSAEELLSKTGLYQNLVEKKIAEGVRPFRPRFELWTDGAEKARWIWLPEGQKIQVSVDDAGPTETMTDVDHWTFPVGTKMWKEFAFPKIDGDPGESKRVETRLIEKLEDGSWEFSAYVWNEDESEATLAPSNGVTDAYPTGENTSHDVPATFQCKTCHNRGGDAVLGFDAIQLAWGENNSVDKKSVTLKTLISEELVNDPAVLTDVHFPTEDPLTQEALGILHVNCGNCHNPHGNAAWTQLFLRHETTAKTLEETATFQTAVNKEAQFYFIPGQESTFRILPGKPEQSSVLYRMGIRNFSQMPPVGTEIIDQSAMETLTQWLTALSPSNPPEDPR